MRPDWEFPTLYLDEETPPTRSPERTLLAAILERACRDLLPNADRNARKQAIEWFTAETDEIDYEISKFTFKHVVNVLELSAIQLNYLHEKVDESELYEEYRRTDFEKAEELRKIIEKQTDHRRARLG